MSDSEATFAENETKGPAVAEIRYPDVEDRIVDLERSDGDPCALIEGHWSPRLASAAYHVYHGFEPGEGPCESEWQQGWYIRDDSKVDDDGEASYVWRGITADTHGAKPCTYWNGDS